MKIRNLAILIMISSLLFAGCTGDAPYIRTEEALDTFVSITAYGSGAQSAVDSAFEEISRVEKVFSEYDNSTELYALNQKGQINASDELSGLIRESIRYSVLTDGAFDITVKPILDLYSYSFGTLGRPPTDEEINETLKHIGYHRIHLGDEIILEPGTGLTLGGIAKGYAIDRAIEVLKEQGITEALVNAGGDMRTIGDKMGKGWSIALDDPDGDDYITIFRIDEMSVATSGNYERYFDEDREFHHIIDPTTGHSANQVISVTIIAPTATEADALATGVFVMGPEDGMDLIESMDVEGLIIDNERNILMSSGFPDREA